MIISVIVAYSKNLAIGFDNKMLWRLSDDFKNYKKITTGHCLVMGRKTFESIGKPLPNRTSIIVTRNLNYKAPDGCFVSHSLEEGINKAKELGDTECFINGGAQIYKEAMALVNRAYITTVDCTIDKADAFFPTIDFSSWNLVHEFSHPKDEKNEYSWNFNQYEK
jgi:dihydrofolate reductase